MYLRIYRTHDHDLMSLHQTGALNIGAAAKAAAIAYYKGEPLLLSVKAANKPDVSKMPWVASFVFDLKESDAEGIVEWANGFRRGYRNCLFKNILRHCLENPGAALFRDDGWEPEASSSNTSSQAVALPSIKHKKREELTGSNWVDAVARGETIRQQKKRANQKDKKNQRPGSSFKPIMPKVPGVSDEPIQEDPPTEDFDAFAAFQKLRNGE